MICLHRFSLNIWDVGGQKSLRSYWRNYFETTDGLIWVVDSADRRRLDDCRKELHQLLQEERLLGATLLVFANKQDLPGALSAEEIENVRTLLNEYAAASGRDAKVQTDEKLSSIHFYFCSSSRKTVFSSTS